MLRESKHTQPSSRQRMNVECFLSGVAKRELGGGGKKHHHAFYLRMAATPALPSGKNNNLVYETNFMGRTSFFFFGVFEKNGEQNRQNEENLIN